MSSGQTSTVTHYAKSAEGDALCGADYVRGEGITAWKDDTTCPRCLGRLAAITPPTSIRTGIQRAETDLASVVTNLSIWEGRGGLATSGEARQESGARALAQLGDVIEALTDWRDALSTALVAFAPDTAASREQVAETSPGVMHVVTPIDMDRARRGIRPGPRCGATGPFALSAKDAARSGRTTCPACLALVAEQGQVDDDTDAERALDAYLAGDPEA